MTELLGLPFSPWTEKARWALDVRGVPYAFRHYQPLIGEPALRLKLRRWAGRVSVPVLTTDGGRTLADSADIARWASKHGEGPDLFPAEHEDAIKRFLALSERALAAGRALSLARMLADREALTEMVPPAVRRALGPFAARVGALGVARTLRKYEGTQADNDAHRRTLITALDEIRAALAGEPAGGSPKTLLGRFTFADITVAQVIVSVAAPAGGLKLGPASRRAFENADLRERYADLVAWRDALYAALRKKAS